MARIKHLYYKDLNGFRFFAFLGAFIFINSFLIYQDDISSTANSFLKYGSRVREVCLEFFFLLSSFLVVTQGLREYKYKNKFSIRLFLIRRFLRIGSVLLVALIFYFLLHPFIISVLKLTPQENINPVKALFLFPYYYKSLSPEVFIYTYVMWTILMFCQLYVLLALILKYLKGIIPYIGVLLLCVGLFYKLYVSHQINDFNLNIIYYGTSIGLGILLAKAVRSDKHRIINWVKQLSTTQIQLIYVTLLLSFLSLYTFTGNAEIIKILNILISVFYAFIILEQTFAKHSAFKFRNYKFISRLGRISYGLILFTPIVAVLLLTVLESLDRGIESPLIKILFPLATFVLTLVFSNLYYNLVESYFLSIKREFKRL